jgi:hypothetical protein
MADARIRSLQVRPIESADLCFDVAGVLALRDAQRCRLGQRVTAAPHPPGIYAQFTDTAPGDPSRIRFDGAAIHTELTKHFLVALRNDVLSAVVSQAISQRQALFLQKYKHKKKIFDALSAVYPRDDAAQTGRVKRLTDLAQYTQARMNALLKAYDDEKVPQVTTRTIAETRNEGIVKNELYLTPVTMATTAQSIQVTDASSNVQQLHKVPEAKTIPQAYRDGDWKPLTDPTFKNQEIIITDDAHVQRTTTSGFEFRHPRYDVRIEGLRALIDIEQELLDSRLAAYAVADTEAMLDAELRALDMEVFRAQLEFAQTYLASPITGIITAVYKDVGEAVQPGEPVVRVENDERLLLVGLVQHRGLVRVGQQTELHLAFPFEHPGRMTVVGEVRSVRGHQADDDEWDIVIECANPGQRDLPLNYMCDRDTSRLVLK